MIVFDMDGTIADFYGVDGWLDCLHNSNPRPYQEARPLWDMVELIEILNDLREIGYRIAITSWLAMNATREFDNEVRQAKRDWLDRFNFPYDEIHLIKYGTTKANCTRKKGGPQILLDDNEQVRRGWSLGETIDPTCEDIISVLKSLLVE